MKDTVQSKHLSGVAQVSPILTSPGGQKHPAMQSDVQGVLSLKFWHVFSHAEPQSLHSSPGGHFGGSEIRVRDALFELFENTKYISNSVLSYGNT